MREKLRLLKFILPVLILLMMLSMSVYSARVHRVKNGEDLYTVARNYGVTTGEVVKLNNLRYPDRIFAGQVLIIPEAETSYTYRVKEGDSLYKIARKLNITVDSLARYNGIKDRENLYVRQVLYIPPRPRKYTVVEGDTLYKIARKYGVAVTRLAAVNNLDSPEAINPGQTLTIPQPEEKAPGYRGPNYKAMFPDTFFLRGNTGSYKVALTFDDGPDSIYTPQILDILKAHNVRATFFLIGDRIKGREEIVRRIINEGHIIANHSWSHPDLRNASTERLRQEITLLEKEVENYTGVTPALFRPPYGVVSERILNEARNRGYRVVHWSVDSRDWINRDVDRILINTIPGIGRDSIIIFHSAGGNNHDLSATVEVLPELIQTLRMMGYQLENLDALLGVSPYR